MKGKEAALVGRVSKEPWEPYVDDAGEMTDSDTAGSGRPLGSMGTTLTAEEIAALWDRWYNGEDAISADLTAAEMLRIFATVESLSREVAALRDRLARADESLRAIGALAHAGLDVPEWDMVEETLELIERHVSVALLSTPTDGAARAGDAAGDEEATDGQS